MGLERLSLPPSVGLTPETRSLGSQSKARRPCWPSSMPEGAMWVDRGLEPCPGRFLGPVTRMTIA